jgi:hypothetical protein
MTKNAPLVAFAGLMLAASAALAQGTGGAAGQGTPGTSSPQSTSPSGPPAFNDNNTPGWSTMSAAERSEHQQRMQTFKTYNECSAYMNQRMRSRPGPGTTSGAGPTGSSRQDATAPTNDVCAHLPRG